MAGAGGLSWATLAPDPHPRPSPSPLAPDPHPRPSPLALRLASSTDETEAAAQGLTSKLCECVYSVCVCMRVRHALLSWAAYCWQD